MTTLRTLDLNLLHVFSVLMEEKSIVRPLHDYLLANRVFRARCDACERRWTMSCLYVLDEVCSQRPGHCAIAPEIAKALSTIEHAVRAPGVFDPPHGKVNSALACVTTFEVALLGALAARIRELAPRSRVLAVASTKRDSVQL